VSAMISYKEGWVTAVKDFEKSREPGGVFVLLSEKQRGETTHRVEWVADGLSFGGQLSARKVLHSLEK